MPATFGDVYQKLCERYPDPRERGRQFEPLAVHPRTRQAHRHRERRDDGHRS